MSLAVGMTLAFVIGEALVGAYSRSLALVSDAGHNFADALALGLSWYGVWMAKKPPHSRMTYGYHRVAILAALFNAISLVLLAIFIAWEAIERMQQPSEVQGIPVIITATIAVILNLVISLWLHADAKHDINIRSAYLHMLGDALSAVGVGITGVIVLVTGWDMIDPIASFLIAGLILWSSWDVLKESINILLEGTPFGMDMDAVQNSITSVEGVLNVHDLHIWTVGPGSVACSCHILVAEQSIREGQQILQSVVEELEHHFGINHTTIQVEVEGHDSNEMYSCFHRMSRPHQHKHK